MIHQIIRRSPAVVEAPFLFLGIDIAEYILDGRETTTGVMISVDAGIAVV